MNSSIQNRIKKLELASRADLPPVLYINGGEGPPRLWNQNITREEALAINASTRRLQSLLEIPISEKHQFDE